MHVFIKKLTDTSCALTFCSQVILCQFNTKTFKTNDNTSGKLQDFAPVNNLKIILSGMNMNCTICHVILKIKKGNIKQFLKRVQETEPFSVKRKQKRIYWESVLTTKVQKKDGWVKKTELI